ncbi:hypothetical protein ACFVKC_16550 [Streptomyces noursei]|uniref:hypothetical protein n=1 Tax=Streptomyces noursei TaxID=1971 RepID=UPI003632F74D
MSTANLPPAGTPADDEGFRRRAGALLHSAAGDLRRTSRSAAADLGLTDADYAAHLAPEQGFSWDLAQRAATVWPLNERDLVPVRNDCPRGVRVLRATESASSARVFQRGGIDYYEYRATAMSRLASFRPAWIRMLSVVTDDDPHNADVHWNNGHMLYQFTYCVGPVNYYYRWNGRDHVLRMNTGDSIWGLPFSPHTFTARNAEEPAYVLALTYGGELMGDAQHELAALGPDTARGFALDTDSAAAAQGRLLRSYLDASALPLEHAAELSGIPAGRLAGVADGGTTLTPDEVTALAAALRLSPRDLLPVVPDAVDGVSVCPAATSRSWYHPPPGTATTGCANWPATGCTRTPAPWRSTRSAPTPTPPTRPSRPCAPTSTSTSTTSAAAPSGWPGSTAASGTKRCWNPARRPTSRRSSAPSSPAAVAATPPTPPACSRCASAAG